MGLYFWAEPRPESITLNKTSISLTEQGQTFQLLATILPGEASQTVVWTTSNQSIATVSQTGLVTCIIPGECVITCTTINGLTAQCYVKEIAYYDIDTYTEGGSIVQTGLPSGLSAGTLRGVGKEGDYAVTSSGKNIILNRCSTKYDITNTTYEKHIGTSGGRNIVGIQPTDEYIYAILATDPSRGWPRLSIWRYDYNLDSVMGATELTRRLSTYDVLYGAGGFIISKDLRYFSYHLSYQVSSSGTLRGYGRVIYEFPTPGDLTSYNQVYASDARDWPLCFSGVDLDITEDGDMLYTSDGKMYTLSTPYWIPSATLYKEPGGTYNRIRLYKGNLYANDKQYDH